MTLKSVDNANRVAVFDVSGDSDDVIAEMEARLHSAFVLCAKGVKSNRVGNDLVVTWEAHTGDKGTDMTGGDVVSFFMSNRNRSYVRFHTALGTTYNSRRKAK